MAALPSSPVLQDGPAAPMLNTALAPRSWWRRLLSPVTAESACLSAEPLPASLNWVDAYMANIRDYVVVRPEDNLLIRMPNQVHQINPTGIRVLQYLLAGGRITDLCREIGSDPQRIQQLSLFLYEIRRCNSGELREDNATSAVEVKPIPLNFSALPVLSEIALTYRCNLRCVFCYAGCVHATRADRGRQKELDTRAVMQVLDRIRHQAKVPSVSFTGGEPTLRPDLPRLVRHAAKTLGMRVNLITNGTLVDAALARRLASCGLASAQVSIEGPDATCHDAVTAVEGSFGRSCRAVVNLRAANVHVHGHTTIHRQNIDRMAEMPIFARDVLGADRLSMNMVIPSGSATDLDDSRQSPLLRYSEMAPVIQAVQQAAVDAGVEFMWYSPTPLCMFNPITATLGNKGCSACDGLLSLDPHGQVLPCSSCDDPVGSLLHEEFDAVWQGAKAQFYQRKRFAHAACRACDSFTACHGACPLYWRHFGFDELEQCSGFIKRTSGSPHAVPQQQTEADAVSFQVVEI